MGLGLQSLVLGSSGLSLRECTNPDEGDLRRYTAYGTPALASRLKMPKIGMSGAWPDVSQTNPFS